MTEHGSTHESMRGDPAREARLEELRDDLDRMLDELAHGGGEGLAGVKERFDRSWRELNELLGPEATRH